MGNASIFGIDIEDPRIDRGVYNGILFHSNWLMQSANKSRSAADQYLSREGMSDEDFANYLLNDVDFEMYSAGVSKGYGIGMGSTISGINHYDEEKVPEDYKDELVAQRNAFRENELTPENREALVSQLGLRAQEQFQQEQPIAQQINVPDGLLPEGEGWERTALPEDVYANLKKQSNGLAIFTRPAEGGFGYEVQTVLMINQDDVDAYRTFSTEQLAAAASLSDEEKPYSIVVDAENIKHDAANAEGAGYMITMSGDVLGAGIAPELLHKEVGEHFTPLVGEAGAFEVMLRSTEVAPSQETLQTPNMSNDIEPRTR